MERLRDKNPRSGESSLLPTQKQNPRVVASGAIEWAESWHVLHFQLSSRKPSHRIRLGHGSAYIETKCRNPRNTDPASSRRSLRCMGSSSKEQALKRLGCHCCPWRRPCNHRRAGAPRPSKRRGGVILEASPTRGDMCPSDALCNVTFLQANDLGATTASSARSRNKRTSACYSEAT